MLAFVPFYKVIVVAIDILESTIIDERHFNKCSEANAFADECNRSGVLSIIIQM